MKKVYSLVVATCFLFAANGFAQNQRIAKGTTMNTIVPQVAEKTQPTVQPMTTTCDTLTNHWHVIYPYPSVDTAVTYRDAKGFVAGHDSYSDMAKAQKFDTAYGVS